MNRDVQLVARSDANAEKWDLEAPTELVEARRPPVKVGLWGALVWGTLAALLPSCQSPALVRTARTLPEGEGDLGLSINLTRISLRAAQVEGVPIPLEDFNLPNPIPDVLYNRGITNDLELGGRLSLGSGLFEVNAKYRYLQLAQGTLHFAVAPAVGYRALALVNGPVLTLPLLVTYDVSPGMSVSGGPLISYASYSVPESLDFGDLDLRGNTLYAGGGVGLQFRPALGLHVMPTVEVQRSVSRRGDAAELPVIDVLFLGVTFGWGPSQPVTPSAGNDEPEVRE
jgi:hypothetical protein